MDTIHDNVFPYKFTDLEINEYMVLEKNFNGDLSKFVRLGPKKYVFTVDFIKEAPIIYNLPLLPGDIFVIGYPRSGTTCTQELVWLIANDLDYKTAKDIPLFARYAFLEYTMLFNEKAQAKLRTENIGNKRNLAVLERYSIPGTQLLSNNPAFIKTHLPFSLLPPCTLATAKVVYIARDPRDVAVSFYHQNRLFKYINYTGDFKTYWNLFINDLLPWCPYFENLKEAWKQRHHPNMLFLYYEELKSDMSAVIRRVANFLNKELTSKQVDDLCDYLNFESFKNNPSVNRTEMKRLGMLLTNESFIRKGKAGSWREYFDDEMSLQAERWIELNLSSTDFRFPHLS